MFNSLTTAIAASQQENWTLVIQCLQQLPIEKPQGLLSLTTELEGEQTLALALQVLELGDFQQRWEIVKILPKLGKRAIAPLIEIWENEALEVEIRWFTGRILSQFNDAASIVSLVKVLRQTEVEELGMIASQGLGEIGLAAIDVLSHLLQESESRLLAVHALAQIRRLETIEPLLTVVEDNNPEIRAVALEALGSFQDERILGVILNSLNDLAAQVRKEAVIALSFQGENYPQLSKRELVNYFEPLLADFSLTVCQQAAIALGRLGTDEAAAAMFPLLKSPVTPTVLKIELVRSLSWIETPATLNYLQEALFWGNREICREIISVLGRINSPSLKPEATRILINFLNCEQIELITPQIKQLLAMSLGELGEATAIESLQSLAQAQERSVSLHAIAALKKIPSL